MAINEVFPNPTVKQVIFQIRFPTLFSVEALIGSYQMSIMEKFPESKLLFQRSLVFMNLKPDTKIEEVGEDSEQAGVKKIWSFSSGNGVTLNVQIDSLDLTSTSHKSYNRKEAETRFRDAIQFAVDRFLDITHIPKLNRIGLRYIDDCPIPEKVSNTFKEYYNTTFNLERFPIETAIGMRLNARVRVDEYFLRFIESMDDVDGKTKLTLDFDAYAENIKATDYLSITDKLHDLILEQYEASIKEPVYDYMREKGTKKNER